MKKAGKAKKTFNITAALNKKRMQVASLESLQEQKKERDQKKWEHKMTAKAEE